MQQINLGFSPIRIFGLKPNQFSNANPWLKSPCQKSDAWRRSRRKILARCETSGNIRIQFRTEGAVDRAFRPFRAAPIYSTVPEASHLATIFGSFAAANSSFNTPSQAKGNACFANLRHRLRGAQCFFEILHRLLQSVCQRNFRLPAQ